MEIPPRLSGVKQSDLFFPVFYAFEEKIIVSSLNRGLGGGIVGLFWLLWIFVFTSDYHLYFSFYVLPLELHYMYCRILILFCILVYLHFSNFSVVLIPLRNSSLIYYSLSVIVKNILILM